MDVLSTPWLTDDEKAQAKELAKDFLYERTPGLPHAPLSLVSAVKLPKKGKKDKKQKRKASGH